MQENLISEYISASTKHLIKSRHDSYRNISQKLNISYGYFRQLMSGNRGLTTTDIYQIARLEKVSVSKLFPPLDKSAKSFKQFKTMTGNDSKADFIKFENQIANS